MWYLAIMFYTFDEDFRQFNYRPWLGQSTLWSSIDHLLMTLCILFFQLNVALSISLYFSPVIAFILYKRGFFTPEGGTLLIKFFSGLGAVYVASYAIRSMGRSQNSQYLEFLRILAKAQSHFSSEAKVNIRLVWSVSYVVACPMWLCPAILRVLGRVSFLLELIR